MHTAILIVYYACIMILSHRKIKLLLILSLNIIIITSSLVHESGVSRVNPSTFPY